MFPLSQTGGLIHLISLVIQPRANYLSIDLPEGISERLPGWLQFGKQFSEELNLLFGNIFGPGEMLAPRGDIFVSFRKHGSLEIQKPCLKGMPEPSCWFTFETYREDLGLT